MRAWNEIAFRARDEVDDQTDYPGGRDPAEDRDQLRVFRVTRFRIFHDPDSSENPRRDGDRDTKKISEAAGESQPGHSGRGSGRRGCILGAGRTGGVRRRTLREDARAQHKKRQGGDRSLHGPNA